MALILDTSLLGGYKDNLGKDVLIQMLDLYKQQSEIYIADIEETVANNEQEAWQEKCHKMKGAAASVGFLQLHAKMVAIEKLKNAPQEKALFVNEVKHLNNIAINEFQQWLSNQ